MSNSALPNDIETLHRLTEAQLGILYQCTLLKDLSPYQNQIRYNISGEFDPTLLKRSVEDVIARHQPLRSVFLHDGLDQPAAVVKRTAELPFERLDLSQLTAEEQQIELTRISSINLNTKIVLDKAPLMRFMCIKLAAREFHLIIDFHHIIYDGWSNVIFFNEIKAFYAARLHQVRPLLPPATKFSEFIAAQSHSIDDDELSFWKNKLNGLSEPTPLPLDKQSHTLSIANAQFQHHLNEEESLALKTCARENRITTNALIVSAWAYTLSRYTNSEDVVFGMAVNGRSQAMNDHDQTIGLFVNTLPLRLRCNSSTELGQWLQYVQRELVELNQFDRTPLSSIHKVSDLKPGIELFEVLVAFQDFPSTDSAEHSGNNIPWVSHNTMVHENSPLPLTLEVFNGKSISFLAMYSDLRLDSSSVEQLVRHLCNTLRSFANLSGKNKLVDDITMLEAHAQDRETQSYLQGGENDINQQNSISHTDDITHNIHGSISDLFEQQITKTPTALAIHDRNLSFTYEQLSASTEDLKQYLVQIGIKTGSRVIICVARDATMYPALLAMIKIHALFVPVDPSWPIKRIEQIIEDSNATLVLADSARIKTLNNISVPVLLIDGSSPVSAIDNAKAAQSTLLANGSQLLSYNDNYLYVMYTSGSSGTPKGVVGTHSSTLNRFNWMWQQYPFNKHDVCVQKTALCFVDSLWELFGGLLKGVPTHVISDEQIYDPNEFVEVLEQNGATHLVIVPSLLSVLLESVDNISEKLSGLRLCTVSGEFLPVALANLFNKLLPNCTLLNLYGSTEIAADACWIEINPSLSYSSGQIGNPITGCAAHILNHDLKPMPLGAMGELCISGLGVSAGYNINNSTETNVFLDNPFADGLLYRTGDIASRGKDDNLILHGRADSRHKLNGKRIDLLEVSGVLEEHSQINFATTLIAENGQLITWYQSHRNESIDSAALNHFLMDRLPDWMLPSRLLKLQTLPRLASGKIDGDALLTIAEEHQSQKTDSAVLLTDNENALATLWQEILPGCELTRDSRFIDTGGDSLSAMRLNAAIQRKFKTSIPPRMMLVASLKQLARSLDSDVEKHDNNTSSTFDTAKQSTASGRALLEPVIFPAQDQSLYGVIHHPLEDSKDTAVLMCSSISHEYMKLHSLYQGIAMKLCMQGYCVMRFDYSGFGNSSGEPNTININNWRNDIIHASDLLRKTCKKTKITMVVCRLGLPLALSALDDQTTRIIAVDPVYDGQAYTDHLLKLHQFALVNPDRYQQIQTKSHPNERFGYLYSENLLNEIASLQVNSSEIGQNTELNILETGSRSDIDGSGRHSVDYSAFSSTASSSVTIESFPDLHIWSDYDAAQSLILHQALAERVVQIVSQGADTSTDTSADS